MSFVERSRPQSVELLGRERECVVIDRVLSAARRGVALVVHGEAGVGKSARLANWASPAASLCEGLGIVVRRPLGDGDVDVRAFVGFLEGAGYDGWYVLERDVMLDADPPDGAGPLDDVRASAEFLRSLLGPAART